MGRTFDAQDERFCEWFFEGEKGRNTLVLSVLARMERKKGKNALDFWEMAQMEQKRGKNALDIWEMAQMERKRFNPLILDTTTFILAKSY